VRSEQKDLAESNCIDKHSKFADHRRSIDSPVGCGQETVYFRATGMPKEFSDWNATRSQGGSDIVHKFSNSSKANL
jgi:hypothetical protein